MTDEVHFRDDTGSPIAIDDRVKIMHVMNAHVAGREGVVAGLGKMDDRYGIYNGDDCIYVRLDDETCLYKVYPGRTRITKRAANA